MFSPDQLSGMATVLKEVDDRFMERSFVMAREALDGDEVPVGCVFVYKGQEIGCGRNDTNATKNATRHAELVALDRAADWCEANHMKLTEVMRSTTLYVTVEPCVMCASAMQQLHIARVVYGAGNERFGGLGSVIDVPARVGGHSFDIVSGVRREEAIELLRDFYKRENPFAPEPKRKRT